MALSALIVLMAVAVWATALLPVHVSALMLMTAVLAMPNGGPPIAFAGFSTSAFWLVFGGLVIGSAIVRSGLGRRLADHLTPILPQSYLGLVCLIVGSCVVLSFFVPAAMARVVIILPLVSVICDQLVFDQSNPWRARCGLQLAGIVGATLPAFSILTGNLPTILAFGAAERLFDYVPSYLSYLLAQWPPLGLPQSVIIIVVFWLTCRAPFSVKAVERSQTPLNRQERFVLSVIFAALLLWMSDFWHGMAPGWVAMAAGVACLLPGAGIFKPENYKQDIEHSAVMYTAGIIALVSFVGSSGLNGLLADLARSVLAIDAQSAPLAYLQMSLVSIVICLVATQPSVAATMVPIADSLAALADWPIDKVMYVLTASFPVVFAPYQVAPIAVGVTMARIPVGFATSILAIIAAATIILLLPLHFAWLQLLFP